MRRARGGFDAATIAEAIARPGIDPREWISYGTVLPQQTVDAETIDSVEFDDEGMGPLVNVKLHPSGTEVVCRVGGRVAGSGEGEYVPFIEGDEVLVAIPMGDVKAGCVIIARLNNGYDKWPDSSIAGQDPTKNTFSFTRIRTPYIAEYASTYMLRHAKHGAFVLLADSGVITIRDGSKGALQMGPDLFSFMEGSREVGSDATPSPTAMFQIDLTGRRAVLQVDDAQLMLNSTDADANAGNAYLTSPGEFNVILGTNTAAEHVATVEAVVGLLTQFLTIVGPLLTTPIPPVAVPSTMAGIISAAAATPLDSTQVGNALALSFQAQAQTPKPAVDPVSGVQLAPGLGAVLFKTG